jgi:mannose-6-phosphate isomerase-like protein (cupin superfamily)
MIDSKYLQQQLDNAEYEPSIGIRIAHLSKTLIGGTETQLIVIKLDPGKALIPHLHEIGGEIWIPLTQGEFILGDAEKDDDGKYKYLGDKVAVKWEEPFAAEIGKSFEVPAGKAHFFRALKNEEMLIYIFIPSGHLKDDKKFVVPPSED